MIFQVSTSLMRRCISTVLHRIVMQTQYIYHSNIAFHNVHMSHPSCKQVHLNDSSYVQDGKLHGTTSHILEVCGYSIFATRFVPVAQDRYPYPYPTRTQNYSPTRPVPAGIPVPAMCTVKPFHAQSMFLLP